MNYFNFLCKKIQHKRKKGRKKGGENPPNKNVKITPRSPTSIDSYLIFPYSHNSPWINIRDRWSSFTLSEDFGCTGGPSLLGEKCLIDIFTTIPLIGALILLEAKSERRKGKT